MAFSPKISSFNYCLCDTKSVFNKVPLSSFRCQCHKQPKQHITDDIHSMGHVKLLDDDADVTTYSTSI